MTPIPFAGHIMLVIFEVGCIKENLPFKKGLSDWVL